MADLTRIRRIQELVEIAEVDDVSRVESEGCFPDSEFILRGDENALVVEDREASLKSNRSWDGMVLERDEDVLKYGERVGAGCGGRRQGVGKR